MRKVNAFIFTTLEGYFEGPSKGDLSWHKQNQGEEEQQYAVENLQSGATTLLFGRITYEMMAGYWPTPQASKNDPAMAEGMNKASKIVFSKTLKKAGWNNTKILSGNIEDEINKLKQSAGTDMTLLGSGSVLTQLAEKGLLDELKIMIDPIIIGKGTAIFNGAKHLINLELTLTKTFKSGVVLHVYRPIKN